MVRAPDSTFFQLPRKVSRIPSLSSCARSNFQFHIHKTHKLSVSLHIITYLSSRVRIFQFHSLKSFVFFSKLSFTSITYIDGAVHWEWIRVKRSNYKTAVINAIICKQYDGFYDCFRWYNPLYDFLVFPELRGIERSVCVCGWMEWEEPKLLLAALAPKKIFLFLYIDQWNVFKCTIEMKFYRCNCSTALLIKYKNRKTVMPFANNDDKKIEISNSFIHLGAEILKCVPVFKLYKSK